MCGGGGLAGGSKYYSVCPSPIQTLDLVLGPDLDWTWTLDLTPNPLITPEDLRTYDL